jgi:hypothetical protein
LDDKLFRELLQSVFWIASASVAENSVASIDWLQRNPQAFPDLWLSILDNENVLNSEPLLGKQWFPVARSYSVQTLILRLYRDLDRYRFAKSDQYKEPDAQGSQHEYIRSQVATSITCSTCAQEDQGENI